MRLHPAWLGGPVNPVNAVKRWGFAQRTLQRRELTCFDRRSPARTYASPCRKHTFLPRARLAAQRNLALDVALLRLWSPVPHTACPRPATDHWRPSESAHHVARKIVGDATCCSQSNVPPSILQRWSLCRVTLPLQGSAGICRQKKCYRDIDRTGATPAQAAPRCLAVRKSSKLGSAAPRLRHTEQL